MNILVTGANGFVGKAVCAEANLRKLQVVGAVRLNKKLSIDVKIIEVGEINERTNWQHALVDCNVVIHLAARVHVMQESSHNPLAEFRQVNVAGTLNLAKQAIKAGVKRFIFVSSIKVNGENTPPELPFAAADIANPQDAYGLSKYEAEKALLAMSIETGLEVVIIRTPLVYGAGVKANFKSLIKLAQLNIPLPFGAVNNKRSLVFIENLIDFILLCTHHPNAANQTFLISDDDDISTTRLIQYIKEASGKRPLLIPVPQSWLRFVFQLIGKSFLSDRLLGNLQVDITKAKTLLNWKPPFTLEQGINKTIEAYLEDS
jgi:nucleoside-diphosphate-sugar epimerase